MTPRVGLRRRDIEFPIETAAIRPFAIYGDGYEASDPNPRRARRGDNPLPSSSELPPGPVESPRTQGCAVTRASPALT